MALLVAPQAAAVRRSVKVEADVGRYRRRA